MQLFVLWGPVVNGEWQLVLPLSPSTVYILTKSYVNLAVQSCFISIQMCKLTFTSRSLISNFHSGSFNGCFSKVHPAELGGTAIKEVLARANVKGEDVCEVIMGNVGQVYSKTFSIVFLSSLSLSLFLPRHCKLVRNRTRDAKPPSTRASHRTCLLSP